MSVAGGTGPMRRISRWLFLGALLLLAYVAGSATDGGRKLLEAAETTFSGAWQSLRPSRLELKGRFVDAAAGDAAAERVRLLAPTLAGSVLMAGGRHRFLDRCPGFVGCVAVEYDRHGRFVHAYPFRPEAYEAVLVPHGLAERVGYEQAVGYDFAKHADVFAIDSYANGDLVVVFYSRLSFPPTVGIARVARDGQPRWFRADGSHHWPTVAHGRVRGVGAGLPDAVVAPGRRVGVGWPPGRGGNKWEARMGRGPCAKHFVDYLLVIDGDGALLREIPVTKAIRDSLYAPLLEYSYNACDPLHLNSVAVLPVAGPYGLAAGDFLVSLRGVGALAVLGAEDGRLKRIWRGSFFGQHGGQVLATSGRTAFLLFDNWGREGDGREPGRLLALDVRSGREWTVFPNALGPAVSLRSGARGGVSIAPDGSRAIVHAYASGQAVEVDLASGETTAVFRSLDDVSALPGGAAEPDRAYLWRMRDIRYVAAPPAATRPGVSGDARSGDLANAAPAQDSDL